VNNGSLFHLLRFCRGRAGGELIAALMLLAAIWLFSEKTAAPLWSSLVLTEMLLLVATAYPWYFTCRSVLCVFTQAAHGCHERH